MSADDFEARLKKAQEDRAALAAKRAEAEKQAALQEKVVAEEMALANEVAIDAAEQEHGKLGDKIAAVYTDMGVVIVKRADTRIFKKFQDVGSTKTTDLEKLVLPCCVYPDVSKVERILEERPAVLMRLADAVVTLAGARSVEVSGK